MMFGPEPEITVRPESGGYWAEIRSGTEYACDWADTEQEARRRVTARWNEKWQFFDRRH